MGYKDETKYYGRLAPFCEDFIKFKRIEGNKYFTESKILSALTKYALNYDTSRVLIPKELANDWISLQPGESGKTAGVRETVVRQFAKYLVAHGEEAYILPNGIRKQPRSEFIPYVFTKDEIDRFFRALDKIKVAKYHKDIVKTYGLLFRVLYGTGMRLSEVLGLKMKDVDLKNGILSIWDTKFHKTRLLPMSKTLHKRCKQYAKEFRGPALDEDMFFPNRNGEEKRQSSMHGWFRKGLWAAGIHYRGKGKGPRIHDLRHTFAVHSLKKWVDNGKDIYTLLPILCTYLGHGSIHATEYYLRLTSEIYPDILKAVEENYGDLVPRMEVLA